LTIIVTTNGPNTSNIDPDRKSLPKSSIQHFNMCQAFPGDLNVVRNNKQQSAPTPDSLTCRLFQLASKVKSVQKHHI
jgi:hypothetical protein